MAFPSSRKIKKLAALLDKVEGTLMISPDATPLEKFRWDLCQKFIKHKRENDLSQDQMAEIIGVDKSKMSKILRHRIDEFSTDRLITLCLRLEPKLKLRVG